MSHLFFGQAAFEVDKYLKMTGMQEPVQMPIIKGIKENKLSERDRHLNPFLQEREMQLFNIHKMTKKQSQVSTVFSSRVISTNQGAIHSFT